MADPTHPDDVDALLKSPGSDSALPPNVVAPPPGSVAQDDIELLLRKAEQALASIDDPAGDLPPNVQAFPFADFAGAAANSQAATLELMRDVELDLTIELGRTHMHLEDVLKLKQGAVVPLDKLAGDPADIYVNGRLIARGEVLVLNDNFCVRVAELIVGESACA
jgi:flagellar motor switch protein FliN/FliY